MVLHLDTNEVSISRNVIFYENIFPFKKIQSSSSVDDLFCKTILPLSILVAIDIIEPYLTMMHLFMIMHHLHLHHALVSYHYHQRLFQLTHDRWIYPLSGQNVKQRVQVTYPIIFAIFYKFLKHKFRTQKFLIYLLLLLFMFLILFLLFLLTQNLILLISPLFFLALLKLNHKIFSKLWHIHIFQKQWMWKFPLLNKRVLGVLSPCHLVSMSQVVDGFIPSNKILMDQLKDTRLVQQPKDILSKRVWIIQTFFHLLLNLLVLSLSQDWLQFMDGI